MKCRLHKTSTKPETGFEKIPFTMQFMRWATLLAESLQLFLDKSWEILDSVLPFSHQGSPACRTGSVFCCCFFFCVFRAKLVRSGRRSYSAFTSRLHSLTCIKTPRKKLAPVLLAVLPQILKFHVVPITSTLC